MQNSYDLKRYAILYVDDEEKALKYFVKTFADEFRFMTATNAAEGLKLIEQHGDEIAIVLSDQRMPGEKGVQLLERTRQLRPRILRILVTAYSDFNVTVDAVNLGNIFRYISKPLQTEDVRHTLHRAMEFFILQQERDDLLREKLFVIQNMLITDRVMGLGVVAARLGQHLRHTLRALHAFLDLAPGRLQAQDVNLDSLRDPTFWRDFHGMVSQQCERIGDLLGDFQTTFSTAFDPAALIQAECQSQTKALADRGITLVTECPPALPEIQDDPALFRRLISLLLLAQTSVMTAGGHATLRATSTSDSIVLDLMDDGKGLPADALRSVFDPFFINTVGPNRSGLGLMGAFLLAYHLGGRITTSKPGVFPLRVTIPVQPVEDKPAVENTREFITNVLMNDTLWERLLPAN